MYISTQPSYLVSRIFLSHFVSASHTNRKAKLLVLTIALTNYVAISTIYNSWIVFLQLPYIILLYLLYCRYGLYGILHCDGFKFSLQELRYFSGITLLPASDGFKDIFLFSHAKCMKYYFSFIILFWNSLLYLIFKNLEFRIYTCLQ